MQRKLHSHNNNKLKSYIHPAVIVEQENFHGVTSSSPSHRHQIEAQLNSSSGCLTTTDAHAQMAPAVRLPPRMTSSRAPLDATLVLPPCRQRTLLAKIHKVAALDKSNSKTGSDRLGQADKKNKQKQKKKKIVHATYHTGAHISLPHNSIITDFDKLIIKTT